jgi:hypothetical protein
MHAIAKTATIMLFEIDNDQTHSLLKAETVVDRG